MPRLVVSQKLLLLSAINDQILFFPQEILEIIKEYLFYDKTRFHQKKVHQHIVSLVTTRDPRQFHLDVLYEEHYFLNRTKKVFIQWGYIIPHKNPKKSVQLQAFTCTTCGNYVGLDQLVRKHVPFCNRVMCSCLIEGT